MQYIVKIRAGFFETMLYELIIKEGGHLLTPTKDSAKPVIDISESAS